MHDIPFAVARVLIELSSPLSPAELGIEGRLGPFFGAPPEPLARVALRWQEADGAIDPPDQMIYDPGAIWRMHRAGEDTYAVLHYQTEGSPERVQAVLRANPAWDDLILTERRGDARWRSLLAVGAGELILRTTILGTGGLVLHAAALDDNGRGVVFVAHAGVGKSTQLSLWRQEPGVMPINEDRTAVLVDDQGAMAYGTPWGGTEDTVRNHAAPLAAMVVLEQAPENAIEALSPTAAAPLLSACAFLPYWDPALMRRALANLDALLVKVPVYRLRCRPERVVIPMVRGVL